MAFVWDEMGIDIAQYLPNVDACNVLISMLQVGREDSTVRPPLGPPSRSRASRAHREMGSDAHAGSGR